MTGLSIPFVGLKKQYNNLRTEILAVTDEVLRSGCLMNGNQTVEFEHWVADRCHSKYAVTCHSGTQALEMIAEFYATQREIANPPTVMIPNLTYAATANAFMRAGWNLHFVDVDCHGVMDLHKIPQLIDFQALVLVGLYGASVSHLADTKAWRNLVHGDAVVIEDAAQHWLAAGGTRVGRATAISFDPMKNLPAYGNGGAVVTNDAELATWVRNARDNGKLDRHRSTGTNSRMSELDCAQLLVKAQHLDVWQGRRRKIAEFWMERFRNSNVRCLITRDSVREHGFSKFVIDVDQRDRLHMELRNAKIETRIHYENSLSEMGGFRQWPGPDLLGSSFALSRRVLSLPFYPELTDLEVEYITDQALNFAA